MTPEPIGKRLRRLRSRVGKSASEIANSIGVSVSTYREWEYGRAIRGEPYEALAKTLEVSIVELLTGRKSLRNPLFLEIEMIEEHLGKLKVGLRNFQGMNETR